MSPVRIPGGKKPTGNASALDLFLTQLQHYVENLPILGDIVEIVSGREDGDPNDIGSMINKAKNVILGFFGFRAAISSRVSAIEGKIATGAEFYDNFNRGENTGALVNGWVQGGDGQPLGIRDQAAMVIQGGLIATAGRRWAKSPQAASGDAFTVSMVTYPDAPPSQYAETWLFARMNAAFTEGLAVRMVAGKCWLSRVSRSSGTSNTWTVTDIASNLTKSYTKSAIVDFRGEENVLQVSIESTIVLTATDSVHAIDAAHRENGFAVQTTTLPGGFSPSYSGGLDSYALKSVVALQSVTTTATVVATATVAPVSAAVTAGSTGAALPAGADSTVYTATKTVADKATTAVQQSVTTAIIVQQQQQNQNAGAGGMNKVLKFPGSGALNSTDWTASSAFVQASNQMALAGGLADGFWFARTNYVFNTDDQAAYAQLGSEANNDQFTFLCLRCNNTGLQGVACRVSANSIAIGAYTFGGDGSTSSGFSTAASVGRTQNTGDSIEFRAIGTSFVVLVNGVAVLTYNGPLGSVGTSWRNSGVIKQKASGAFGITFYSFNLSSFGIYDYGAVGSAATNRVAARISRIGTGSVTANIGNNAVALVPDNFFSTIDYATGMTVTDIATGSIRVDTADWYEIEVSLTAQFTSGLGDAFAGQTHWVLFLNGSQYTQGLLAGMPHKFQFAAGDIIRVGLVNLQWGLKPSSGGDAAYSQLTNNRTITAITGGPGAFVQISRDS